jgi:hypothetical protein
MSGRESPRSGPLPRSGSQSPERGGEQARVPGTHATYRGFSPDLPAPPPPPPLPQRPSSASPAGGAAEPVRSPSTSPTRLAPKLAQVCTIISHEGMQSGRGPWCIAFLPFAANSSAAQCNHADSPLTVRHEHVVGREAGGPGHLSVAKQQQLVSCAGFHQDCGRW